MAEHPGADGRCVGALPEQGRDGRVELWHECAPAGVDEFVAWGASLPRSH